MRKEEGEAKYTGGQISRSKTSGERRRRNKGGRGREASVFVGHKQRVKKMQ